MKHLKNKIASCAAFKGKEKIQMNNTIYKNSKEKNYQFKNLPLQSIVSHLMFITWKFLFEYCLIGIVKPRFTRRNKIWCKILEIECNVFFLSNLYEWYLVRITLFLIGNRLYFYARFFYRAEMCMMLCSMLDIIFSIYFTAV